MGNEKAVKLNSDIYPSDFELLDQVIKENSLMSRKEGLHVIFNRYRGIPQDDEKQENSQSDCEFLLCGSNKKLYCVYESYGRHRLLVAKEECNKCKIHLWKLPQKTKIPLCPRSKGLYNPKACETCFQAQPTIYANCETQRFFKGKTQAQNEPVKVSEKPARLVKNDELAKLRERERIRTDALKERMLIEVEAEKARNNVGNARRTFHGANRVDWGNSNGFDAFELGDR